MGSEELPGSRGSTAGRTIVIDRYKRKLSKPFDRKRNVTVDHQERKRERERERERERKEGNSSISVLNEVLRRDRAFHRLETVCA